MKTFDFHFFLFLMKARKEMMDDDQGANGLIKTIDNLCECEDKTFPEVPNDE